jgi:hypothetical protein
MAAPPLELGAVQETVALVAVTFDAVGAAGALGTTVTGGVGEATGSV